MKPSIVNSIKLQTYLSSHKWIAHQEEHFIRYTPDYNNIEIAREKIQNKELLVPREIIDRPGLYSIMDRLWLTLSEIYSKSEKELVLEIENPGKEIVSIRLVDEDTQDGSISYNRLINLMSSSKSLISENLLGAYNPRLLHQITMKKIKNIFQESKVIGIEQGSFILKLQMPSTLELTDKDMFYDSVVIKTIESFDNAHKNIDFFENEIIDSAHSNNLEAFIEQRFDDIQTDALSATFRIIDKFPKSHIEFSTASNKNSVINIDSKKYTKDGLGNIKNIIHKVQEQHKKQERVVNGLIFDIVDDEIRNGQSTISIAIKDDYNNEFRIPQIEMAYRGRLMQAIDQRQPVSINGIIKPETNRRFKVTHLKSITM